MSTNTRSIELNPFQRQGLETVVERLREVLWLCVDGDVSFEADEYIQSHVLGGCIETPRRKISEEEENRFRQQLVNNGTLFAVFRLFRELDQENVSGYCEEIQFPGSQVWSCYNYVSELIQPWNRWRAAKSQSEHGRASTAIAAFLTPEEEQRKPIALQKIRDKIKFFEDVLTGVKPDSAVPSPVEIKNEGTTRRRMSTNVANENLKQLLESDPKKYMEMGQAELASEVGCSRGTLGKTSAYRIDIPKLLRKLR